jgi:predicted ATPase/DNA-binding winged helix-turn-helix (wHTH) protein
MKMMQDASTYDVLTFGDFRLDPVRFVLHKGASPVRLGSRALEILILLAQRAGQVVTKNELLDRVWPKGVAQEATLRVHIAALRKALGDGGHGTRYVENFSGRGYRFVAPVTRRRESSTFEVASTLPAAEPARVDDVPVPLSRMVGCAHVVAALTIRVLRQRLVTIVGPGGAGKSLAAAAVVEKQVAAYEHGVRFVDLSAVNDSRGACEALGAALGLAEVAEDGMSGVLSFLQDKSTLIVLDNCERVVEAAAALAERVLQRAPGVHLLATSREPLRAVSEYVHRLPPLELPAPASDLVCAEALAYPAIQLFVERASASLDSFKLTEEDLPAVVEICRRLEGNPLAIELAAARVDFFGVRGLAGRLEDCLGLLTRGPRTAAARHQSLRASLDWSYELLSPLEQTVLRRLATLAAGFSMESANETVADGKIGAADVFDALTNLVAKSLVHTNVTDESIRYRLSDAARAYAMEKLLNTDESSRAARLQDWSDATNVIGWK